MVIQVRSVPESHEWEVMVEPSTEASRPTRMLVHESNSSGSSRRTEAVCEPIRSESAKTAMLVRAKSRDLDFLIAYLLTAVYNTPLRSRSIGLRGRHPGIHLLSLGVFPPSAAD